MPADPRSAERPDPDPLLVEIADYVCGPDPGSEVAHETARLCLRDALACAFLALRNQECVRRLGPVVPGATIPGGARVPGTRHELDPVQAAFNLGTLIRWLDFNDTWLAAEWGHPSDNLGAILAVADHLSRRTGRDGEAPLTVRNLLTALIQAYEIQGVLALGNSFNRFGLDHVILVRVASAAVATRLLGGTRERVVDAVANAWLDGAALRTYRHAPNTGPRKSWAAGDATSRGVRLALMAVAGEPGYPSAVSTPRWGLCDVLLGGQPLRRDRAFGSYVIENVLFKVAHPAEFHAQTAVECALQLHPHLRDRLDAVERVAIETQEPAVRIIDKTGPLHNPADRDHCLQYMVAVPLIFGRLAADDYAAGVAADPRIDALRARMVVTENAAFTRDYYDLDKRHIANAVQVFFRDGGGTERVQVDCPLGHRQRRAEALPVLQGKFESSLSPVFGTEQRERIRAAFADDERLDAMAVADFVGLLTPATVEPGAGAADDPKRPD